MIEKIDLQGAKMSTASIMAEPQETGICANMIKNLNLQDCGALPIQASAR